MSDKLVVITGGSKGIGLATALIFAKEGWRIAICARNKQTLEKARLLLLEAGATKVFIRSIDLREKNGIYQFAQDVLDDMGVPHVLVNNAGTYQPGALYSEDDAVFEMMMETNLNSTYYTCKAFIPSMQKQKSGHVVNVCSTASIMPYVNGGSYCISKYGQYGLTKVLREEMKPFGIRVTAVLPGATRTESWDGTGLPPERFVDPGSIAQTIFTACMLPDNVDMEEVIVRPFLGDIE